MAQARFDASTKHLIEFQPEGWLQMLGLPASSVAVIDADISSVSGSADKVLRVLDPHEWLLHLELQAGYDAGLPDRTLVSNVLLGVRHQRPVRSAVILLARRADGPEMHGRIEHRAEDGASPLTFDYDIIRLWRLPVEPLLTGSIGLLPLAPLAAITAEQLPSVVQRMEQRINHEVPPSRASELWTSTYLLMGLRFKEDLVNHIVQGVQGMKESVTYQRIYSIGKTEGKAEGKAEGMAEGKAEGMAEGKAEEAQALLIRMGTRRFNEAPSVAVRTAIENTVDLAELEAMADRLFDVDDWDALIGR